MKLNNPKKIFLTTMGFSLIGFIIQVMVPYQINSSHGSLAELSSEDSLSLKGQEIYQKEGCQYCHTKNLRPFAWELKRFDNMETAGYFPEMTQQERYYDSPSLMGSQRIGPDLSRIGTKMDANKLRSFLNNTKGQNAASSMHKYGYLFSTNCDMNPLALSWKIKILMNMGMPYSDAFHKSSMVQLEDKTRGDALVAYLMSLGKKHSLFTGNFYK